MEELLQASATAQARALRERAVSSVEFVRAHLARIEAVNGALNAMVRVDAESAIAAAYRADEALRSGAETGPFHGVPFTAKDWIETAGIICAAGFAARKDYVPKRDATVVARMRAAGAILLGKSNVGESNEVYGATRNPHDLARSPGASSSGEASIVAAGGSPLGLGSDSGGSLRYPAHCCGVATLKPTTGRVPLTGHFPRIGPSHDPRTVIGPLSRHVEDLLPALQVIAGPDWRDPSAVPVQLDAPEPSVKGRRIGWYTAMPGAEPSAETVRMVEDAAGRLRERGAQVEPVTLPRLEEAMPLTIAYWKRVQSAGYNEWAPDKQPTMTVDETERSIFEWDRFRRAMLAFFEPLDAVLCPAAEQAAPLHGGVGAQEYIYTVPFSLTGYPVAVVRAGTSAEGLPLGIQVVARPWREGDATAVASAIAEDCGPWPAPAGIEA